VLAAPHRPVSPAPAHKGLLGRLGPRLITGASDGDPSGIATLLADRHAVRLRDCWGDAVLLPADGGDPGAQRAHRPVTGQGITGNIRAHYFRSLLHLIVAPLLIANMINLGADLGAMAAALKLGDRRPDRSLGVLYE